MTQTKYQCCFCGQSIIDRTPDPCGLAFTAGYTLPPDKQVNQGFFCHIKCFEERLHASAPFYAKDILEAND
jgi:hypothetical protein